MSHPVIEATLFEPGRSRAHSGKLVTDSQGQCRFILDDTREVRELGAFRDFKISDRLASVPRVLTAPDGTRLETLDNDGIDDLRNDLDTHSWLSYTLAQVARIEHSARVAALSAIILVGFAAFTYWSIVPFAAKQVAFAIPEEMLDEPGDRASTFIYQRITIPSKLSRARQTELQDMFSEILSTRENPGRYTLRIRTTKDDMVNAFALPDGTIVMLDGLIKMAANDDEIMAVMAHEIGHVDERHSVRGVLQASALSLILLAVFGDASGAIDLLLNFPVLAMLQSYSREFEREADRAAIETMTALKRDPEALATMLERMTAQCGEACENAGWFSSHPGTKERAADIRKRARDLRSRLPVEN